LIDTVIQHKQSAVIAQILCWLFAFLFSSVSLFLADSCNVD